MNWGSQQGSKARQNNAEVPVKTTLVVDLKGEKLVEDSGDLCDEVFSDSKKNVLKIRPRAFSRVCR